MKHVDEYRDSAAVRSVFDTIRRRATRSWTIMEVCGGQTHGLLRYGFDHELAGIVELLHGPGCPVCVTSVELIDRAIDLAQRPGVLLTSFGDMLRVPGSRTSLLAARSQGAQVRAVYSPLDAVALAEQRPHEHVVFFAVGFETTAPATALAVRHAAQRGLTNFSLLVAHVRVQPAMENILRADDNRVQAFLAAGHVCTVVGYHDYDTLTREFGVPIVVTGFEPLDLAWGIERCVDQLEAGTHAVENAYPRSVHKHGNAQAIALINEVYEVCDRAWRGLGVVRDGGLQLKPQWDQFNAQARFALTTLPVLQPNGCRSGEVLAGRIKPPQCAEFGQGCTPERPLGAPMVSHEGACAAYFFYHAHTPATGEPPPGVSA